MVVVVDRKVIERQSQRPPGEEAVSTGDSLTVTIRTRSKMSNLNLSLNVQGGTATALTIPVDLPAPIGAPATVETIDDESSIGGALRQWAAKAVRAAVLLLHLTRLAD